jgi:membrane-associated phospholipid phosphatase
MVLIAVPAAVAAQVQPLTGDTSWVAGTQSGTDRQTDWIDLPVDLSSGQPPSNPFRSIGGDLKRFFTSQGTWKIVGPAALVAAAAMPAVDEVVIAESRQHWEPSPSFFKAGNVGGGFLVQTGAAVLTYGIGRAAGSETASAFGGDLLRAQIVSQVVVQAGKLATQRPRPDGSNHHAFPSGHAASAFATATVVRDHFGWRAGVPAFAFAAYVGAARMSANKHHISDVLMGAAVGIAAGRVVSMDIRGRRFDVGVSPTQGGAAVTFTAK